MTDDKTVGKSIKNVYDENTGLPIMINLYVIKYIYYHIKKADMFMEKDHGRKAKAYPIYGEKEFPVSRQRFDRISKGYNFMFTRDEADKVTEIYGIDGKYFSKKNPAAFKIDGISEDDWKCFYYVKYKVSYELPYMTGSGEKKIEENAKKIKASLEALAAGWKKLQHNDPVYAVCHYFHYGKRVDEMDIISKLKKNLSAIEYRDWDKEDIESLKELLPHMERHYKYISSLVAINELKEKEGEKK